MEPGYILEGLINSFTCHSKPGVVLLPDICLLTTLSTIIDSMAQAHHLRISYGGPEVWIDLRMVRNIFKLLLFVGASISFTFYAWTRVIAAISPTLTVFQHL